MLDRYNVTSNNSMSNNESGVEVTLIAIRRHPRHFTAVTLYRALVLLHWTQPPSALVCPRRKKNLQQKPAFIPGLSRPVSRE